MDGGDGHPTTGMYLMLLNRTIHLTMVKMLNLMLGKFYHDFLKFPRKDIQEPTSIKADLYILTLEI